MKILLKRIAKKDTYTIGKLYINNNYFCDTLEDKDRGLDESMSLDEIKSIKKDNITAIPTGTYIINLSTYSVRFGNKSFYKKICNGRVPRLVNVKGFDGILIHCGNTDKDTSGCILVGENKVVGKVINSQKTFEKLYNIIKATKENILITIQ